MTKKKDKILPIKVWLDEESCWNEKPQGEGYTEYIRTDTFIEKACELLKAYRVEFPDGAGYIPGVIDDRFIEIFKKAMVYKD